MHLKRNHIINPTAFKCDNIFFQRHIPLLGGIRGGFCLDLQMLKITYKPHRVNNRFTILCINRYIFIGDNIFNFHDSDDCIYQEWIDEVEDNWFVFVTLEESHAKERRKYIVFNFFLYLDEI
jgi:hypothetical protein